MEEKEISNIFYVMRFFALCSIVLAHSIFREIPNECVVKFLQAFARCGVVIFFIISGYYFNKTRYKSIFKMLKSKTSKIIIPWFVWGMIVYFINIIRQSRYFNFIESISWILGCGTYLWYLTILFLLLCIFQLIPNKKIVLYGCFIVTIISIFMIANNINPFKIQQLAEKSESLVYIALYLNVFNWIGFFAIGIFLKKYNVIEKYGYIFKDKPKYLTLILILILLFIIFIEKGDSYWTNLSIMIELIFCFIIFIVSVNISKIKLIQKIGAVSLPIYLLHMIIQGPIFNRLLPKSVIMGILRPVIVILFIYYLLMFGLFISKKIHMEKVFKIIFGLK